VEELALNQILPWLVGLDDRFPRLRLWQHRSLNRLDQRLLFIRP